MAPEPVFPGLTHRRWKDEFVPELNELVRIDVEPYVVLDPLTEHLFVDTGSIGSVGQVVGDRRSAPANMERKLNSPGHLANRWVVQVLGYGYRPCRGPQFETAVSAPSSLPVYGPQWRARASRHDHARPIPSGG